MHSKVGRPSVPPERLLKATLLMAFYSVRSERLFCEQLDYNLLFRWFLDMDMVEESIDHSTFSRNRARLLEADVAAKFLAEIVSTAKAAKLMSDDHFTVDGTLIEPWASVEEIFGWAKTVGSFRKTRFRGKACTQLAAHLVAAAYNLLRMAKLMMAPA